MIEINLNEKEINGFLDAMMAGCQKRHSFAPPPGQSNQASLASQNSSTATAFQTVNGFFGCFQQEDQAMKGMVAKFLKYDEKLWGAEQ